MERHVEVVVVGAGTFGLGAAAELARRRFEVSVLDRADGVGDSWRRRYDGLRLNSVRWMSGLPGTPIPRRAGPWPSKEDLVAYLERYVQDRGLDVRLGVNVDRIDRSADGYRVETSTGPYFADAVVVAAGFDRVPKMPDWPGRAGYPGELIHSVDYRNPAPYRGRDVLVVGAGNTGTEVAVQLADAGARKVWIAVRTPPNLVASETLGLPMTPMGALADRLPPRLVDMATPLFTLDLSEHGLERSPYGLATEIRVKGLGVVVDRGFSETLRAGRVEVVGAVERFDGPDVVLAGAGRLRPDAVIAATGYRMGLEPLVGHLGVLDANGRPSVFGGMVRTSAPRLYFSGYYQPIVGQLPQLRRTSRAIGRAEARARRARAARSCGGRGKAKEVWA
jgi:putative flavoprotein involved in K+ transport